MFLGVQKVVWSGTILVKKNFVYKSFEVCSGRVGLMWGVGGLNRVNVRRRVVFVWFGLVRLFAKFKTSRMFPCGIFWCGSSSSSSPCSCCCDSQLLVPD